MAQSRYRGAKAKRHPGGFVALPHAVIRSTQFTALSAHGVKLLADLLAQYNGSNNGDLCATWSLMHERGWRSRDTLGKALRELVGGGWISLTRQGGLHQPSLYGVTFFALDPSPKLEVSINSFPRGAWCTSVVVRGPQKRNGQHARRDNSARISTLGVSIDPANNSNRHARRAGGDT